MEVKIATLADIERLTPTILELRPHLKPEDIRKMLPVLLQENYQIIFVGDEKLAFSLAGFRTLNLFYSGKTLYIDDLVTHPLHRKKGYGEKLLNWLKEYARENNYDHFSLDSGFQRKDAHRLYLNVGLEMEAFHIGRKVADLK